MCWLPNKTSALARLRVDSLQPLGDGAEAGMKRRQQIHAEHVPPETAFIQRRIDPLLNFSLSRRRFAPVNAGRLMVNGMVTVVEQHQVNQAGEVAGVIVG